MLNLVDIEKGLYGAEIKKRRHFILFLISTFLIIFIDVILMLTSKDNYIVELVLTIIFSAAYFVYLVFYFTVIKRCLNAELRFFEGVKKSELSEVYCEAQSISDDVKEYNGLEYYVVEAIVDENLKKEDKIFYAPQKFKFKKNEKLIFHTFGSIIINVETRK